MVADALTKVVMVSGEAATPLLRRHRAGALLVSATSEIRVTDDWEPRATPDQAPPHQPA
jgi:thiamine biosynthesis lipoprotein